jgi:hypothetical protein
MTKIDCNISEMNRLDVAAPEPPLTNLEKIEDCLECAGVPLSLASRAAEPLEDLLEDLSIERAGEMLRHLALRLGNSRKEVAFVRAFLGDQGESLRDAAARCEPPMSAPGLLKSERRARKRLTLTT